MIIVDELLSAAGVTDSQLPPSVVVTLVVNDTAAEGTDEVNVTGCDRGVVEPRAAVGVQAVGLGVTVGGVCPGPVATAMMLPFVRLKTVGPPKMV